MSSEWTIELREGNGYKTPLSFFDENNQPVDLDGANIRFIVNGGDIEWSSANGKVVATAPGVAELRLTSTDVANCDFTFGSFEWRIDWADTTTDTIMSGKVWKKSN